MNTETVVYTLESLTADGWSDDPCLLGNAANCNVFESNDAAQAALRELQLLWPDSTLRIRCGDSGDAPAERCTRGLVSSDRH